MFSPAYFCINNSERILELPYSLFLAIPFQSFLFAELKG